MKKFAIFCLIFFLSSIQAFANCDYSKKCAPRAYDLTSKGCQVTSKITGMTFLGEKIAQLIIKKELTKATKEHFKVEIKSYSAKDLLQGRFSYLKISGKNLDIEDAYLTKFEAKTVCNFNYVQLEKNSIKFKENMLMNFNIEISDKDLRKTVASTGYLNMLNKINLSGMGITFFKLSSADVQIKNNHLYFKVNMTSPFSAKPIPIILQSDLKIENGKIVLTKIALVNIDTIIDLSRVTYLLNMINPLTFSTDIMNNKNSKISINDVNIINDTISIKGNVFIPKNTVK